jgi:hypothetical protein
LTETIHYVAVLDTNVMLEAASCIDLAKHYESCAEHDVLSNEATFMRA